MITSTSIDDNSLLGESRLTDRKVFGKIFQQYLNRGRGGQRHRYIVYIAFSLNTET